MLVSQKNPRASWICLLVRSPGFLVKCPSVNRNHQFPVAPRPCRPAPCAPGPPDCAEAARESSRGRGRPEGKGLVQCVLLWRLKEKLRISPRKSYKQKLGALASNSLWLWLTVCHGFWMALIEIDSVDRFTVLKNGWIFHGYSQVPWFMGQELCGGCVFPLCFFDILFCPFSLLFAEFWRWQLPLQHVGVRTSRCSWYLQHVGARSVHIAQYFAGFI